MAWHEDTKLLVDFAKALAWAGVVEDITEVIDKPYKYEEYFEAWKAADYPTEEDETWDEFVEAIKPEEE